MDVIKPISDAELSNVMLKEYFILWEVRNTILVFKNSLTGKELIYDNNDIKLKEININGIYTIVSK